MCQEIVSISQNHHKCLIFQGFEKTRGSEVCKIIFQQKCGISEIIQNMAGAVSYCWHI
jgi:hypothetical protein